MEHTQTIKLEKPKQCTCCGSEYKGSVDGRTSSDFVGYVFFECSCGSTLMGSTAEAIFDR